MMVVMAMMMMRKFLIRLKFGMEVYTATSLSGGKKLPLPHKQAVAIWHLEV